MLGSAHESSACQTVPQRGNLSNVAFAASSYFYAPHCMRPFATANFPSFLQAEGIVEKAKRAVGLGSEKVENGKQYAAGAADTASKQA